ncbi:hypothetical protein [Demequina litorisediminis]|nr:hypothetical protein [Demequina litorisediminis]
MTRTTWLKAGGAVIVAMVVAACAPAETASSPTATSAAGNGEAAAVEETNLSLVGFAVPKAANNAIQEPVVADARG